jgi:dTMP kinase
MKKGIFITFEGPEGSGKSTQMGLLAEALRGRGFQVTVTREPGGSIVGREIRRLLLNTPVKPSPEAELLLFLADRADHVASVIRPALERGEVVLCDRYADSTLAYQGGGRGLSMARLRRLNREATGNLQPHLTFLMDLPAEKGLLRAGKREGGKKDRMESEHLAFHRRVRATFRDLAKRDTKRFRVLDATRDIENLSRNVLKSVVKCLPREAGIRLAKSCNGLIR